MRRPARPASIRWFELLFLVAYALRLLNIYLARAAMSARIALQAERTSWPATIALFAFGILVPVLGAWLAARRANRVAAWLLVIWMILDVSAFAASILLHGTSFGPTTKVALLTCALYLASAIALFMPASRAWLARRRAPAETADDFV
jgi:hypothetical protein